MEFVVAFRNATLSGSGSPREWAGERNIRTAIAT